MRILIAEDDRATARLLSGLVESWGFEVSQVANGHAAVAAITQGSTPHLVLLDWMLPGLNGPEVCLKIREQCADAPPYVILLTSRSARADVVAGLNAGADEYLVKPFDPDELHARLNAGARIVCLQSRLGEKVRQLGDALASVRRLSGLLPICCYCHSIRDDSNYWHRVEEYVGEHAEVTFSHGICPECLSKAAGELLPEG